MSRRPKYYKSDKCECDGEGCETCTCADCGEWLEYHESSVCEECLDKFDED